MRNTISCRGETFVVGNVTFSIQIMRNTQNVNLSFVHSILFDPAIWLWYTLSAFPGSNVLVLYSRKTTAIRYDKCGYYCKSFIVKRHDLFTQQARVESIDLHGFNFCISQTLRSKLETAFPRYCLAQRVSVCQYKAWLPGGFQHVCMLCPWALCGAQICFFKQWRCLASTDITASFRAKTLKTFWLGRQLTRFITSLTVFTFDKSYFSETIDTSGRPFLSIHFWSITLVCNFVPVWETWNNVVFFILHAPSPKFAFMMSRPLHGKPFNYNDHASFEGFWYNSKKWAPRTTKKAFRRFVRELFAYVSV